ncbi:hypothetical protein PQX77_018172 [Marasmius sp. AFHP31]|nr:hypothetical protein PQX77_018172 [Marasmius sp. AFHP31]
MPSLVSFVMQHNHGWLPPLFLTMLECAPSLERVELTMYCYLEGCKGDSFTPLNAFLQLLPNVTHPESSMNIDAAFGDPALGDRILSSILSGLWVGKDTLRPVLKLEFLSLDIPVFSLDIQVNEKVSNLLLERHSMGMQALRELCLMGSIQWKGCPDPRKSSQNW